MYTLLLVDDEEEVIEAIVKKVKWEELGFQVAGHANNGFKAMDMLEEMQPDVVMTDIRMPYMDGLELCAHIKAKYPATKILLFTGFDDFEYAKSFLAGKNYSKKQAYFELVKRGVSELQVKKVIENYGNIEKDTIKKLIKKLSNKDEKKRIETLLRKGFDYSKIKEVLKELKEEGE